MFSERRCGRVTVKTVTPSRMPRGRLTRAGFAASILTAALLMLLATGSSASAAVRAAFYHPWTVEDWSANGPTETVTRFGPTLGEYTWDNPDAVAQEADWMRYAGLDAAISDWGGPGTPTDDAVPSLLAAGGDGLQWSLLYRPEAAGDPSSGEVESDLTYIADNYATDPAYLQVGGKPVLFVASDPDDDCSMATRWRQANTLGFFIVLRAFPGYASCPVQPDGWHQSDATVREAHLPGYSYEISPGYWPLDEAAPRLARDPRGFNDAVLRMAHSGEPFQLVNSWNDWAAGSAVESADEWVHPNCLIHGRDCTGQYLNKLHKYILDPIVSAAGDIACDPLFDPDFDGGDGTATNCRYKYTAPLLAGSDAVLALGDEEYGSGDAFDTVYDPTWGQFKSITHPILGDHEYESGANFYFDYFGAAAGDPAAGYYSFDVGAWHMIALNSNCAVVSCAAGSAQEQWLRADLADHAGARCTLAYWHHPHFTDGPHVPDDGGGSTLPFWQALTEAHADLVLDGNDHSYQRWARMDANGQPDAGGMREFIVGTGGKSHTTPTGTGAEVRNDDTFGVLKLYLHDRSYDWRFVPESGKTFTDEGTDTCRA
jgi:hypothetical protein